MELSHGVRARAEDTVLARRAADLLAGGPADAVTIAAYVLSLPSPPARVAERLVEAIFAGRPEFVRGDAGRWTLDSSATRAARRATRKAPEAASRLALSGMSFAVVDVETTGSQPHAGDRITEIGVAVVRDGAITSQYETLVNPQRPIPPFITRLTNITWEMVRHAPTFDEIVPQVMATISGHVFVAHNATFDWRFVSAELSRAAGQRLDGRRLCTVRLARRLLPQLPRRSLDYLAGYYGITIEGRHRAGGDALATAKCLMHMLAEAQDRGCETWADLEHLGRKPRARRPRRAPARPTSVTRDTTA